MSVGIAVGAGLGVIVVVPVGSPVAVPVSAGVGVGNVIGVGTLDSVPIPASSPRVGVAARRLDRWSTGIPVPLEGAAEVHPARTNTDTNATKMRSGIITRHAQAAWLNGLGRTVERKCIIKHQESNFTAGFWQDGAATGASFPHDKLYQP